MKILYVEDNEDNIFMLKNRLARAGYTVAEDRGGIRVICEREQQMFKCRIFMAARTGNGESPLQ